MKTKRFLFYTGGADSTLLLSMLLDVIQMPDHIEDELVLLPVCNDVLGSGQIYKLSDTLQFAHDAVANLQQDVGSRISILNPYLTFPYGTDMMNGMVDKNVQLIKMAEGIELRPYMKGLAVQETILLGIIPSLVVFLGLCRNKFYMGMCGSDMASAQIEQLQQLFNLQFQIITYMNKQDSLELECACGDNDRGSMFTNKLHFPEEWIPTLEFPLVKLKKSEVLMLLDEAGIKNFRVDKIEDLLENYAYKDGMRILSYTSIYHDTLKEYPDVSTSLFHFIKTGEIMAGDEQVMNETKAHHLLLIKSVSLLGRGI